MSRLGIGPAGLALILTTTMVLSGCAGPTSAPDAEELRARSPVEPCGDLPDWELDARYDHRLRMHTNYGSIELVIYSNEVPGTASVILNLADSGFYDGTRIHRVIPGFAMFGGDPNSRDETRRPAWGGGGPGFHLPSEFHPFLGFDDAGVVGLATAGPNTGGSQFFITFGAVPEITPVRPVIGHVDRGMDVVRAIEEAPRWTAEEVPEERAYLVDQPKEFIDVISAEVVDPPADRAAAPVGLAAASIDCSGLTAGGFPARFLVHVRNTGNRILNTTWTHDAPDGWTVEAQDDRTNLALAAGQTEPLPFNVTPPPTYEGTGNVTITFTAAEGGEASIDLTVTSGPEPIRPGRDDTFLIDYAGVVEDGRVFDSTEPAVFDGTIDALVERTTGLEPLECRFQGAGVACRGPGTSTFSPILPGFADAVEAAALDQASVVRVPPARGFGEDEFGPTNLGGRTLYYHVVIRHINS